MKKMLFAAAVLFFTACGSGDQANTDSAPVDTTNPVDPAIPDTATLMNDTNHVLGDTSNMMTDTPYKRDY